MHTNKVRVWDVYLLAEDYKFFWQVLSLSISLRNMYPKASVLGQSVSSKQQKPMRLKNVLNCMSQICCISPQ